MISKDRISFFSIFSILFLLLLVLAGFFQAHAQDSAGVSKDERTLIIPVFTQVKIYHTGLGFTELRDDWGKTALENILKVLAGELRSKGIELRNYIIPTGMENEFDEVKALYLSVSGSMNYRYPEGAASVDFTVGPIRDFLVESDSKYLLFVHALDKVVTGGRKATKVFTTFLGVDPLKWGDITAVDIGLLNSSGKVVWHGMKWSGGAYDLRDFESAASFVLPMLKSFSVKP